MQRKDLALRVLSTAAIMSIVTSIAAPAFADVYYIGNGSIDVKTMTGANGEYVQVTQNGKTYTDTSKEIVIKDGTSEKDATLKEAARAEGTQAKPAVAPAAGAATQELEAADTADAAGPAAGESQPDPDAGFTLNETGEDSAQTKEDSAQNQEGNNPTENPTEDTTDNHTEDTKDNHTEPPKKDVVYQYDPAADPNPEQQATKLAPTTSAAPAAETREATLADAPAPTTPATGSVTTPTTSVIKVINNWVNHVLNIRLDNVNIKSSTDAAMTVSGDGDTKIELDGKNTLDSSNVSDKAGLNKQGNGTMTITDEKTDGGETRTSKAADDKTGSLTVVGGNYAAGIGGNAAGSISDGLGDTKNITIEGYATVDATSCQNTIYSDLVNGGAAIGGGRYGSAENITIQGNANVTARTKGKGAVIGGGVYGSGTNIGIYDHATVTATTDETGAAIGRGYGGQKASVIIGSEGKTQENENVHVTAKSHVSAIGGMAGSTGTAADQTTDIVIQGGATIDEASCDYGAAIGGDSGVSNIIIRGHAVIKKAGLIGERGYREYGKQGEKATVSVEDHARLEDVRAIGGQDVEEVNVTVKDNAYVGAVYAIGDNGDDNKIGKLTAKILDNATIEKLSGWIGKNPYSTVDESEVIVDGGKNGKVTVKATDGNGSAYISANTVQIKNNVLLKLKQSTGKREPYYIAANGVEMTRDKLMQTIGADAEIWYTDKDNKLQKIVHGKNVCKHANGVQTGHEDATCGKDGYTDYKCGYETANGAANTSCDLTWQDVLPATGLHDYGEWNTVKEATCTTEGQKQRTCKVCNHVDTQTIPIDPNAHNWGDWTVDVAPTCTAAGQKSHHCTRCNAITDVTVLPATGHQWHSDNDATHTCNKDNVTESHTYNDWVVVTPATCTTAGKKKHTCTECGHVETQEIPATGHHWKDNGDGTHTCPDCGATEGQPVNTNSALELRVVDAEGMNEPFTVNQNGTLRTYTGAYDIATLTGDLNTLRYLQDHGAQTIQFVTNGQTSSFAINDLLAQGSGSEVFYLTHRGAEEPTLLLVEADHSELVKD